MSAWTGGQKLGGKNEFRFKDINYTDVCRGSRPQTNAASKVRADKVGASLARQRNGTGCAANR